MSNTMKVVLVVLAAVLVVGFVVAAIAGAVYLMSPSLRSTVADVTQPRGIQAMEAVETDEIATNYILDEEGPKTIPAVPGFIAAGHISVNGEDLLWQKDTGYVVYSRGDVKLVVDNYPVGHTGYNQIHDGNVAEHAESAARRMVDTEANDGCGESACKTAYLYQVTADGLRLVATYEAK